MLKNLKKELTLVAFDKSPKALRLATVIVAFPAATAEIIGFRFPSEVVEVLAANRGTAGTVVAAAPFSSANRAGTREALLGRGT